MAKIDGAYVVPTDARAEYRKMIQRANRRILSNIKYIKENEIRDNQVKTMLAGDYTSKRKWATKKSPFSYKTSFASEKEYRDFVRFVERWGKDTGGRGGYDADVSKLSGEYRTAIYKSINGLLRNQGISLEKWGGDLPPEFKKKIDGMSLEQLSHFWRYQDPSGEIEEFDSDQVAPESVEDFLDYVGGNIDTVIKYYPTPEKKKTKKNTRRKSRKKNKGRKKI